MGIMLSFGKNKKKKEQQLNARELYDTLRQIENEIDDDEERKLSRKIKEGFIDVDESEEYKQPWSSKSGRTLFRAAFLAAIESDNDDVVDNMIEVMKKRLPYDG